MSALDELHTAAERLEERATQYETNAAQDARWAQMADEDLGEGSIDGKRHQLKADHWAKTAAEDRAMAALLRDVIEMALCYDGENLQNAADDVETAALIVARAVTGGSA